MRAVAERAGVSTGNAYYYFRSKEHLVQGFYERCHLEHLALCEPLLEDETGLRKRLHHVLTTKIESAEPYHRFSGLLFRTAADPRSPLNPFSDASAETRAGATELMGRVVAGSNAKIPADLRKELPDLLWLYEMAIILFWIHDDSPGRRRTHKLVDRTVDIIAKLVSLASYKVMAPLRKATLGLVADLRRDGVAAG